MKGIGRSLITEGIAEDIRHNFTHLELETWGSMHAAVHLYESFGWVDGPDPIPETGADRFYSLTLAKKASASEDRFGRGLAVMATG